MNFRTVTVPAIAVLAIFVLFPMRALSLIDNSSTKTDTTHSRTSPQNELQLLDTAATQLGGSPAELQSKLCLEIALGYGQVDRLKAARHLSRCFRLTLKIEEANKALKTDLQSRILDSLASIDSSFIEEMLPIAEPGVRVHIESLMLEKIISNKDYDQALSRIAWFSHVPEFPYKAAARLMTELPSSRDQDRRLVFMAALSSYRLQDPATDPKIEDFATLLVRFGRTLPPQLAMQGIDEVLDHAKQDLKSKNAPTLTIGTAFGEAQFSTGYQYRLFELLPLIEEIDSSRAESLLRDHQNLASVLQSYPKGLQSLEPTYRDTPLKQGENPQFAITYHLPDDNSAAVASDLLRARVNREAADIVEHWLDDPKAAVRKARELPDIGLDQTGRSPKADVLARISATAMARRPAIADEALEALLDAIKDYPSFSQGYYFVIAAGIYFRMSNIEEANSLIHKAMSIGSKLYELDTNSDKPNQAFKFDWPSSATWRACVLLEDKISPLDAASFLREITDPEIRAEIQVTLANTRLGIAVPSNTVRRQFTKGLELVQTFPIPH